MTHNALALYLVQFTRYLLPLITIPYIARVLGPEAWGSILFVQSFGLWLGILVDYGFNLSATREVAQHATNPKKISDIAAGILGAKGLLLLVVALITLITYFVLPPKGYANYLWLAWLLAASTGLMPIWYFQGTENLRVIALLEFCSRVVSVGATFLFIHQPQDAWKILFFQALSSSLTVVVGFFWLYRAVPYQQPTWGLIQSVLRSGWSLFLSNVIGSFYTAINSFILGLLSTTSAVSFYGASERITRTALSGTQPVTQVLFPRMSQLLATEPSKAVRVVRLSLAFMTLASLGLALILMIFAPVIINILLGVGFEPAIPVLRVLSLLIPLISWGQVLGLQWLIPLGFDNVYVVLGLIAGSVNIILAVLLASRYGALGMAWSVVAAEFVVVIGILVVLHFRGKNPLFRLQWEEEKS